MKRNNFKDLYQADIFRYGGQSGKYVRAFHYYFRKAQTARNPIAQLYYRWRFRRIKIKHGIELYYGTKIGKGLYLGHPYNITVNANAVLGNNVNLSKGITIGQENRGKRKGSPTIGDNVWIGVNATVVGNIKIGNDVLIAPNSYVNCDIPDHSVVFGNPCIIKSRDNATEEYITNVVQVE